MFGGFLDCDGLDASERGEGFEFDEDTAFLECSPPCADDLTIHDNDVIQNCGSYISRITYSWVVSLILSVAAYRAEGLSNVM